IIIPNDTQRAAIFAMMRVLDAIDTEGHSGSLREQMVSFQDREKVVRTADYLELDRRYAV
ncbi:MAG: isocitrate lyase, partial [Proteobacteria bacterium]